MPATFKFRLELLSGGFQVCHSLQVWECFTLATTDQSNGDVELVIRLVRSCPFRFRLHSTWLCPEKCAESWTKLSNHNITSSRTDVIKQHQDHRNIFHVFSHLFLPNFSIRFKLQSPAQIAQPKKITVGALFCQVHSIQVISCFRIPLGGSRPRSERVNMNEKHLKWKWPRYQIDEKLRDIRWKTNRFSIWTFAKIPASLSDFRARLGGDWILQISKWRLLCRLGAAVLTFVNSRPCGVPPH